MFVNSVNSVNSVNCGQMLNAVVPPVYRYCRWIPVGFAASMRTGMSFKPREIVRCRDGVCPLPRGLQPDQPARVVATYFAKTYVLFDGKTYLVPNACIYREDTDRLGCWPEMTAN